jgi:phage-related protein
VQRYTLSKIGLNQTYCATLHTMETFNHPIQEGLSKTIDYKVSIQQLGESYSQIRCNPDDRTITWQLSTNFLTNTQKQHLLLTKFEQWNGITQFSWLPTPDYDLPVIAVCRSWDSEQVSRKFIIQATFEQVNVAGCIELDFDLDVSSIPQRLQEAWQFILTYTRDSLPNFANAQKLPLNDFMNKAGRRNYFPRECGTTEALYNIAYAILKLYLKFNNPAMLQYAIDMIEMALSFLYRTQPPTTANAQIWLPHWLYTGRGASEIKGTTVTPNFLNSGVHDQLVNFSNGLGFINVNLADVYRVHDGAVLWKFVNAPLISGSNYDIDYYINKYNEKVLPSGETLPNDTALTPGQVKLTSNFTGQLKVIYSFFTGNFVAKNQPIEAFPMWRATLSGIDDERNHAFDVSFWAHEVYQLLKVCNVAQSQKWDKALQANIHSTLEAAKVINESFIFKVDTFTLDPQSYVGVQLILINGKQATLTRLSNGNYQINQNSQNPNDYGAAEMQNFAIYSIFGRQTYWDVNFKSSTAGILFWGLSTSQNPIDTSQTYYAPFFTEPNTTYSRQFNNLDFIKWGNKTNWHSTNADTAIATYQGNGGSSTSNYVMQAINSRERLACRLAMNKGSVGFAGGVLALLENRPRLPLKIMIRTTGNIIMKLTDGSGNIFTVVCNVAQWQEVEFTVGMMLPLAHNNAFDQNNPIAQIEFQTDSSGELFIWYVGRMGDTLPYNSYVFKHLVSNRQPNACIWELGNCEVKNSPLNELPYNPAIVPFTANYVGSSRVSWTGSPHVGYQLGESMFYQIGRGDLSKDIIRFKLASQDSYASESPSGSNAYFRASFNWSRWDAQSAPPYNVFIDSSPDPNYAWEGYTHRAIESAAKYWFLSKDVDAGLVVMRYLRGLYRWVTDRLFNNLPYRPPTDYIAPSQGLPLSLYETQHGAGYLLRTAIYANLAGGDEFITCSIIKWNWEYLENEYVTSGTMLGSWCKSQPAFTMNSQQYREYFPFWHGEIILAYLLMDEYYSQLRVPVC